MSRIRAIVTVSALSVSLVALGACSSNDKSSSDKKTAAAAPKCEPVGDPTTAGTTVAVTLTEWVVKPVPATAPAGNIAFEVTNDGTVTHEMIIFKGIAPNDLPLKSNGSVNEDAAPEDAVVGEIAEFPAGGSCTGVFTLEAGEYTLFCNVAEAGGDIHYKKGMVTTFTVT